MDELEELMKHVQQIGKTAQALSAKGMSRKTVIVHPQMANTQEEAKKLAEDWGSAEEKQLMDNLKRLVQ